MLILAIESSCDDTAAAVLEDGSRVLASVISSQHSVHEKYGGVVPELASRCHIEAVWPAAEEALRQAGATLDEIGLIAATQGPGLVGCLLVGFTFARSLALVRNIPCVGVDHLAGHLLAILLEENKPAFPYAALVASGGTSSLFAVSSPAEFRLLGRTRDDAAGEAFDKVAKMLDLGCPGGPAVSRMAAQGRSDAFAFPRALADGSVDFSFSGLKTAVMNQVSRFRQLNQPVPVEDICASFEQAVADALVDKTILAAKRCGHQRVALGGGVAANQRLRRQMSARCAEEGLQCFLPSPLFCTDNAAMIGLAGWHLFQAGQRVGPDADAFSRSPLN